MSENPARKCMPSRWKRLLYSVMGVVAASLLAAFTCSIPLLVHEDFQFYFAEAFVVNLFVLGLSLIGWVVALPLVLLVTNLSRWRFWVLWAAGTLIGPLVMFGIAGYFLLSEMFGEKALYMHATFSGFDSETKNLLYLATAVACLTTLIYLLLVRWDQKRRSRNPASIRLIG